MPIFSGIQPTGVPHIGNYFGALRFWKALQAKDSFFSIVDLHSLSSLNPPTKLGATVFESAGALMACGIQENLFVQSRVRGHTELAWILGCLTPTSYLERMTTWKSKLQENALHRDKLMNGLLSYPLLQAADILLYGATQVPVGEDQRQHIELTRVVARFFNTRYGPLFQEPRALIREGAKIASLSKPEKKMSKSDPDSMSRIDLDDPPELIQKKIKRAVTDSIQGITYDVETRPGIANLCLILACCQEKDPSEIAQEHHNRLTGEFKVLVADALIAHLTPIRTELMRLKYHPEHIATVLQKGQESAQEHADRTLKKVDALIYKMDFDAALSQKLKQ